MAQQYKVVSADNHIIEPRNLWLTRLPKKWRDKAPRVVAHPSGGDGWSWDGGTPKRRFDLEAAAGRNIGEVTSRGLKWEEISPGNYDPAERLKDQDRDGVDAVVIYPHQAIWSYTEPDREFAMACLEVYNDWVLEDFQGHNPRRIMGLPLVATEFGEQAMIAEFDRCVAKGARAMFLPGLPDQPYHAPYYEPLWDRAEKEGIALTFHRTFGGKSKDPTYDDFAKQVVLVSGIVERHFCAVRPFTYMLFANIFGRHPGLRIIAAEVNCGWMPFWLETMDYHASLQESWCELASDRKPSDFIGENVFVTVLNDNIGFQLMSQFPRMARAAMYSTDYPHSISLWPNSRKWIAQLTAGFDESVRTDVLAGNATRVYDFAR
jgi:predicted TIM-barrel fold metal-dependent hydrolase